MKKYSYFLLFVIGILLCSVWMGSSGMAAETEEGTFVINAQVFPSDTPTYDVEVTVENRGADWEGMVRLTLRDSYGSIDNCSYDTMLSLPQGSKKQFTVKIPKNSLESTDGNVCIELFDNKAKKPVALSSFNRLLQGATDALAMGILSDKYSSLTYLDMGGEEAYYNGHSYPVKLTELNQDNLMRALPALHCLVIDSYDTSVLTDETVAAIEKWTENGGMLIIGTGNFAQETLSAFDALDMHCVTVYPPGDSQQDEGAYAGISQLHMAQLEDKSDAFYTSYGTLARMLSQGDGAVCVLPYALTELGEIDIKPYSDEDSETDVYLEDGTKVFIKSILNEMGSSVSVNKMKQGNSFYYPGKSNDYFFYNLLELFGNGSARLHFGGLKVIVMAYVVFVGPVLYLILRFAKKRDYYWWTVPVSAVVGILLVYWTGRGFEVVNTRVYSMTLENLSDEGNFITYLHCYDADHNEWDLRLAEKYQYAGFMRDNYYGIDNPYYYHSRQDGDRLSFGADPNTSFEDCYFQAGGVMQEGSGSILGDINYKNAWEFAGTVANNTNRDFAYFAVIADDRLALYKNLPAGTVCDLSSAEEVYHTDGSSDILRDYVYEYIREVCNSKERTDMDMLSALGMGLSAVYLQDGFGRTIIIGVTDDWDKTVDDSCSEAAYGCLYTVQ